MNVSAVLVTRGDVDMTPIKDSLIASGIDDIVIWNNRVGSDAWGGRGIPGDARLRIVGNSDLAVYGRYAAIAEAKHDLILTQDDDVVLPPESIAQLVDAWLEYRRSQYDFSHPDHKVPAEWANDHVVANQPAAFRHDFYSDHCLVGFGAVFHRDLPQRAFERLNVGMTWKGVCPPHWSGLVLFDTLNFRRTCDVVFTALTPRVLVDVPYENLPWATGESRMYRQNGHVGERTRMLELVRAVRDAG